MKVCHGTDIHQTSLFAIPLTKRRYRISQGPRPSKRTGDAPQHVEQKAAEVEELEAMHTTFEVRTAREMKRGASER